MPDAPRPIFRADAVRRYLRGREESVLPRFVSPRSFAYLWILLGLLVASGLLTWLAEVPVYASGPVVVVDGRASALPIRDAVVLVAFLPPRNLARLRVGQTLWLTLGPTGERLRGPILAVEPKISSPDVAQKRFGSAVRAIRDPAAVVMARWPALHEDLPASTYLGSVYRADIETGARRVISFLPLVGRFFGE